MTYSPGSPGYQPAQPSGPYGAANPFGTPANSASKLPLYLQAAVVVLGLGAYLASFGPMLKITDSEFAGVAGDVGFVVPVSLLAALLAGAGLLPNAKNYSAPVGAVAVLGALLAVSQILTRGEMFSVGWALWLVLVLTVAQAIAAVGALLLDAGVVAPPAPKPQYDPYAQYGLPPGGGYYGSPGQPGAQQSGYPSYGGGYPGAPSTGGFGSTSTPGFGAGPGNAQQHSGPPTPPTGFPSFSPPPGGATGGGPVQGPAGSGEQPQGGHSQEASSSAPPGPTQS